MTPEAKLKQPRSAVRVANLATWEFRVVATHNNVDNFALISQLKDEIELSEPWAVQYTHHDI